MHVANNKQIPYLRLSKLLIGGDFRLRTNGITYHTSKAIASVYSVDQSQ